MSLGLEQSDFVVRVEGFEGIRNLKGQRVIGQGFWGVLTGWFGHSGV